jgi:hypothetical protein
MSKGFSSPNEERKGIVRPEINLFLAASDVEAVPSARPINVLLPSVASPVERGAQLAQPWQA